MPVPHRSDNFGDLLDVRFERIFNQHLEELPDKISQIYDTPPHNGRNDMRWSEVGGLEDWTQFTGTVNYASQAQGYDTTMTFLEWTQGTQVERTLFDDDQYQIMDQRPQAMAVSSNRTRQRHAARLYAMGFSNDTLFQVGGDGQALFSDSHTTTAPGVSTAVGFDNKGTSALSAVSVAAARLQMKKYRDDVAGLVSVMPNVLRVPIELEERAWEIVNSSGKLDTAENNDNFMKGRFQVDAWEYLDISSTSNWFLEDSRMRAMFVKWVDRIPVEFAMVEDFDTLLAKFRGYMRYAAAYLDWRWGFGAEVS